MNEVWRRRAVTSTHTALWAGICALAWYESRHNDTPWELITGLVCTTVSFATVRRYPLISLLAATLAGLNSLSSYQGRYPLWPVLLMFTAGYLAGRRMKQTRGALLVFAGVALAGLPIALLATPDGFTNWGTLVLTLLFAAFVPWHLGRYLRLREDLMRTGWERAEQLEARQRAAEEQARLRERARIAGDMHDSLGHELSLIALRAAAIEVAPDLDERHRAAAGDLRRSAAQATERLREIIGVLREAVSSQDGSPIEPAGESILELVDRARNSGLLVEARIDDTVRPPKVDRAAYRVVQEALTNVAKHAPGAVAHVDVCATAGVSTVTVTNGSAPAGSSPELAGSGLGLPGLRERVRLVGGTLRAGPEGDGFRLAARLPHDAAAVEDGETSVAGSESARQLAQARRKVRLTLINAIALPTAVVVVIFALSAVYYFYNRVESQLRPADYEQLQVGRPRQEVEAVLPDEQRLDRPRQAEPPAPAGSVCEYYGLDANPLGTNGEVYRLCFAEGRLVSKNLLKPVEDRSGENDGAEGNDVNGNGVTEGDMTEGDG